MNISNDLTEDTGSVFSSLDEDITYNKLLNVLHIAGLSIVVFAMLALSALM